jgi:phosphatidylglycerol:prolipoprotein diacylglycerol transferase
VQHWFTYPNIDPVAFRLGPLAIHWYGLSYLVGFIAVGLWMARPAGRKRLGLTVEEVQDFLVYALGGVLIGGRLFFIFADIVTKHNAAQYFGDMPRSLINIIAVWNGGMGFYGGLIGVIVAIALFIRRHPNVRFSVLADETVICNPDQPWCIKFPSADGYRYPSQIFEAILDFLVLPVIVLLYRRRPPDGVVAWTWFTLYGVTRSVAEIWRQTDLALGPITGGQVFSLAMIAVGIFMIRRSILAGGRTDETPKQAPEGAAN